jgi:hypothetical protein
LFAKAAFNYKGWQSSGYRELEMTSERLWRVKKSIAERNSMKTQIVRKGRTWIVSAVLLAGLAYSVLALYAQPAYASNCTDCATEQVEAMTYCFDNFGSGDLASFHCGANFTSYNFVCSFDPQHQFHSDSCVPD